MRRSAVSSVGRRLCGDRFYLEVQRTGRAGRARSYREAVMELARERGVAAVATNDVRFLTRAEFEAHEARVCIHDGALLADTSRPRRYSEEQYLKSPAEMAELFADAPELLVNTRRNRQALLAGNPLGRLDAAGLSRCPQGSTTEGFLARGVARAVCARGWRRRTSCRGRSRRDGARRLRGAARARARRHLQHGLCRIFLDRGRFHPLGARATACRWVPAAVPARDRWWPTCSASPIWIRSNMILLFERFLNPERVSMPDFDVDFCMEGRDRVIEYVANKYGRDRVSQIITYGTLAAKAVVRDVGRVLGHNYGYVDKIAKLIPFEIGMTLDKALEQEEELKRLYEGESESSRTHRSRAQPRGPGAQRRHPCRRRGHRAVGADRLHAAVLRRGQHARR